MFVQIDEVFQQFQTEKDQSKLANPSPAASARHTC